MRKPSENFSIKQQLKFELRTDTTLDKHIKYYKSKINNFNKHITILKEIMRILN